MKKRCLAIIISFCLCGCSSSPWEAWKADQLSRLAERARRASLAAYEKALATMPSGTPRQEVLLKMGRLQMRSGDYAAAIRSLGQVDSPQGRRELALALYRNSDYTGALDVFNKIGEQGDPEYLYDYGMALEKRNLYDQALRLYASIKGGSSWEAKAKERMQAINLMSGPAAYAGVSDEVRRLIEQSPAAEAYPEASALYLLVDENIDLSADLRLTSDFHYVIKVLNDRGKDSFGEVTLTYDSTYEKLEMDYARTVKPDGSVVTVGDKNIRDVSLYLNFPMYSNARARIISMPEVTAGSVIEYKGRIVRSQLPNKKDLATVYTLATDEPILWQKCLISVPENKPLRHKIINAAFNTGNFDMNPKAQTQGGRTTYSLEFHDVPQIIPEPAMPSLSQVNPYILFSTYKSWEDVYGWWRDLYKDKILADEAIQMKVAELTKDKKTPQEKLRAVYNFCAQEIRYVAVEYGDAGYEPHQAAEIFKNKYGDCKDKAILLVTMLRQAGIEAYPVLISTSDSLDVQEDLPSIMFDHAIAAVMQEGKLVFMDPTGMTVSFGDLPTGDQDRLTLVFFPDRYELAKTPLFAPLHNHVLTTMTIKIEEGEGIAVGRQVATQGFFEQAQRYWLKFTMPALIEEQLKQKVRSIADGGILKEYHIENVDDLDKPINLRFEFTAPQWLVKAGATRLMMPLSGVDDSLVVKEKRSYPIEFAMLDFQEERIEIELPAHLAVKYLPAAVDADTPWFHFISRYDLAGTNRIDFYHASTTKQRIIPVEEYAAYKAAVEDLARRLNQQVTLEVK